MSTGTTDTTAINNRTPQHSELHGRLLSLTVAASVTLILLAIIIHLVRLYKKQQREEINRLNRTDVDCQRASDQAAVDLPALPALVEFSTDVEDLKDLKDCAVCLAEIGPANTGRLLPACNHAFHEECIKSWFRYQTTCPVCRSSVLVQPNEKVLQITTA